jgi:hypothetical protein
VAFYFKIKRKNKIDWVAQGLNLKEKKKWIG